MRDGLYQVMWRGVCAGFVVRGGKVVQCAPILRRRLYVMGGGGKWEATWTALNAQWVGP